MLKRHEHVLQVPNVRNIGRFKCGDSLGHELLNARSQFRKLRFALVGFSRGAPNQSPYQVDFGDDLVPELIKPSAILQKRNALCSRLRGHYARGSTKEEPASARKTSIFSEQYCCQRFGRSVGGSWLGARRALQDRRELSGKSGIRNFAATQPTAPQAAPGLSTVCWTPAWSSEHF